MPQNKKIIIYTAIFGKKDDLITPSVVNPNVDYVCFTDSLDLKSDFWDIRIITPLYPDSSTRSAKIFKILPHIYFPEYENSIWIDANIIIKKDLVELLDLHLKDKYFAAYNHKFNTPDSFTSIYDEAKYLLNLNKNLKKYEHTNIQILKQVARYKSEGYASETGLITGGLLLRKHNEPSCMQMMELWWKEICSESSRDELSFNYLAWKTDFPFNFINESIYNNQFIRVISHKK